MAELKWVAERVQSVFLPALEAAAGEQEVKQLCDVEMAFWHTRAGSENSLRTPHTQSRKIVANSTLPDDKKAWVDEYLSFGRERWTDINKLAAPALAERLENQLLLQEPDLIVTQAAKLLKASRWQDIAAGLAAATGRRSTEILKTGVFKPATAYTVVFEGQLKHEIEAYEIPTLVAAEDVIDAFTRLRAELDVSDLGTHDVSNSYHKAVTASVRRHFEHLIPARENETVSTQTLRATYQRLAIYFYAPILVDPDTYAAEIAGHRSRADGTTRSYGAGPNYKDYKIVDRDGQPDGRQGVKLGPDDVKVLSVFSGKEGGPTGLSGAGKSLFRVPVPQTGLLEPESLFTGDMLTLVREGMEAANSTDFLSYLTLALKRQAKNDLGLARRDTVANVREMSMDDLARARKHSTAVERIRRGVQALARYNDTHTQMERFFINATLLSYLIGGRFEAILEYVREHKEEVDMLNSKYDLIEKYNRKPFDVKLKIKEIIPVE
jgi:Telomere resolvase